MKNNSGILVLNSGSTSLKFALYAYSDDVLNVVAQGGFSGMPEHTVLVINDANGHKLLSMDFPEQHQMNHEIALTQLLAILTEKFPDLSIDYAGHRIVLGGEKFSSATKIDINTLDYLESLSKIEPTHQAYEVMGARALAKIFPQIRQSATFDTSFHRSMPEVAEFYPVPQSILDKGVRHWGFHGISYTYINHKVQELIPNASRVIVAHLGGGASLCAIKDGKSVDTSMQFGAITGVPMATRSGDFPADAIFYLLRNGWYTAETLEAELEKHSGLLGASAGLSEDMQNLEDSDDVQAKQALKYFEYAVLKYIGAYTAELQGFDVLVFTAGIGEHDAKFRARICANLTWLGIKLDDKANNLAVAGTQAHKISHQDSLIQVYVIPTNEELMIAQNAVELYTNEKE